MGKPGRAPEIAETYYLENVQQLQALADPLRYNIVVLLATPHTGAQLGRLLGLPRTKVHYHLKQLEKVRLIRLHSLGSVGGMTEKYYVAVARYIVFDRLLAGAARDAGRASMATYKAAAEFLAAMLNASRDRILKAPANVRGEQGFWLDFTAAGTEEQIAALRRRLMALRDEVVAMDAAAARGRPGERRRKFTVTLYLTPGEG